jgi:hypothetical protein
MYDTIFKSFCFVILVAYVTGSALPTSHTFFMRTVTPLDTYDTLQVC